MAVWALGLNHNTAPLDLRGRFAFAVEQMGPTLTTLRDTFSSGSEVAILSTCNRTEIYCAGEQAQMQSTLDWLAQSGGVSAEALKDHTYALTEADAARHAFRVASGLDSMVLGEPQILGQMKDAVRAASEAGALGTTLNQLFQRSFAVAKEVRTSTEIGAHSISMAAAAVRLASQVFEDLTRTRVLFVGAGEMIELCATHFAARRPAAMTIAAWLLSRQFFALRPSESLKYATLALLFVNVSVGGALTHFAAPPVVMVAAKWGWGLKDVFAHFGVAALVSILLSNLCYLLWFRGELVALKGGPEEGAAEAPMPRPSSRMQGGCASVRVRCARYRILRQRRMPRCGSWKMATCVQHDNLRRMFSVSIANLRLWCIRRRPPTDQVSVQSSACSNSPVRARCRSACYCCCWRLSAARSSAMTSAPCDHGTAPAFACRAA